MRLWSILLIKSDLKWCTHLSRSLFLYFNYFYTTWWVSLLVDQIVPEGTCSQVLRSTYVDSYRFESIKIVRVKLIEIVILWVYYTIPFGFSLFRHFLGITFLLHFLYIVSVHIQCQASIYTLSLCRGHSLRVRLAKQETLTPPGHLVSPLVWFAGVRECPPWCYIVDATVTVHQFFCILHFQRF